MKLHESGSWLAEGALSALEAIALLEVRLLRAKAEASIDEALSRPSRRRLAAAILEAEEILLDVRVTLLVLAFGRAVDPGACRNRVLDRSLELLAGWQLAAQEAESRRVSAEIGTYRELSSAMAQALEGVADSLDPQDHPTPEEVRRFEAECRLLARPDLPVM